MNKHVDDLQQRFGIRGTAYFSAGRGGLTSLTIATPHAEAEIYVHGAHVTHYQPRGHEPVLFLSERSAFNADKAIRGGVPICFPWFGNHAQLPSAPAHGFARVLDWSVESLEHRPDGSVVVTMSLASGEVTRRFFPHDFTVRLAVAVGLRLIMTLRVRNDSAQSCRCEAALHSYFKVSDVKQIRVSGLEHVEYLDKTRLGARVRQGAAPIVLTEETDRVYLNATGPCTVHDPQGQRRIVVEKTGSATTVLWNPWAAKSRHMSDLLPDDWMRMVCVETANAGPNAVSLDAGAEHAMSASIHVERA